MGFNPGSGGGSSSIAGSTDVALSSVQDDQVLTYESASSKWQNQNSQGGSPTIESLPAGSTVSRIYGGSSWPVRGTSRTDIIVQWIDFTGSAPTPPGALAEHDIVLIPDAV